MFSLGISRGTVNLRDLQAGLAHEHRHGTLMVDLVEKEGQNGLRLGQGKTGELMRLVGKYGCQF